MRHFMLDEDQEFHLAGVRAYNDWLAKGFVAKAPQHFVGQGQIPNLGIDAAVAEMRRCREMGLRGIVISSWPSGKPFLDDDCDPFWAEAVKLGIPVSVHISLVHRGQQRGHGHHGLARADVALQQPVHGVRAREVGVDLGDHPALGTREREGQPLVERGHRGTILREFLFDYRRRPGSMSRAFDGPTLRRLYQQLFERHRDTFQRHQPAIWAHRQVSMARTSLEIDRLEEEWRGWLSARLADRRSEAAALDAVHGREHQEVAAMRASWSWRLTRPLRRVVGLLRGESGPTP